MPLPGPEDRVETPASANSDYFRLPPAPPVRATDGVSWGMQIFLFVLGALLVISRRPDALTTPQFFAEDGSVWFADAYRFGFWHTLLLPDAGYLQTFPRLIAGLATLVPLLYAPLLMNIVGIAVQVLPVNLLASARLASLGSLGARMLLAFIYLALPNSRELDVVITNAQWHLALIACLIMVANPPRNFVARSVDVFLLVLSGLTGPFCVILLALDAILCWFRRRRWQLVSLTILAICASLQIAVMLQADPAIRYKAPLGASLRLLVDIISSHVFLAAIFGSSNYTARLGFAALLLAAVAGAGVVAAAVIKARWEFRVVILFCVLVFAATLKSPLVSRTEPQWQVLNQANGIRYWFFPMLAFLWSVVWFATASRKRILRLSAIALLVLSIAGMARDWRYPPFPDRNFPQYVARFEALPPGEALAFPLFPDGWTMQLVKGTKCQSAPFGAIDTPGEGQRVSGGVISVRGWANAAAPVKDVEILLDKKEVADVVPSIARPDVDSEYPGSLNRLKGWEGSVDTAKLSAGKHEVASRARLTNGCSAVIGTRSFEVLH